MARRQPAGTPRAARSDGDATRARMLEAAGELFAASGYGETTAKAIAHRADVSLASINYHFGSRSGLYEAVLLEAHRRLVDVADLQALAQSEASAADKLRLLIEHIVRQATKRRLDWHVRVLAREVLAPSSHLQILLRTALPPKLAIIKRIVGDIAGIQPGDPALARCLVSTIAPLSMLLVGPRGRASPLHDVLRTPWKQIASHMHRFAVAGLRAVGQDLRSERQQVRRSL